MTEVQPSCSPTLDERDVWLGANALVDGYGNDAPTQAARKALALVGNGDRDGYRNWLRILWAVEVLLDTKIPKELH